MSADSFNAFAQQVHEWSSAACGQHKGVRGAETSYQVNIDLHVDPTFNDDDAGKVATDFMAHFPGAKVIVRLKRQPAV
jgi:hypothetical protein